MKKILIIVFIVSLFLTAFKYAPKYGGDLVYTYRLGSVYSERNSTQVNQPDNVYHLFGVPIKANNIGQVSGSELVVTEPNFTTKFLESGYEFGTTLYLGEDFNHSHTHDIYIKVLKPTNFTITVKDGINNEYSNTINTTNDFPTPRQVDGYTSLGFYNSKDELITSFDKVNPYETLYAKYQPNLYTVTYKY